MVLPTKGRVKSLLVLVVAAFIIIAAIAGLSGKPPDQNALPTRESTIPTNATKMMPETDPYPPMLHSDDYMAPVPVPGSINTAGGEDSPFIMPDGNTMYFFFTPNVTVPVEKQLLDGVTGIYVARKSNGTWGSVERVVLQDPGKLALDGAAFVQNNTMWFASAREGYTGVNMFIAEIMNGKWANWRYAGDKLNKEYLMGEMHITADGSELYFHSARAGGSGGYDIWVTKKVNGEWQMPESVAAVNTPWTEGWPFITQRGDELWFTREYNGTPAIFMSIKTNGTWSPPQLIASRFAGEPTLDEAGNLFFVHHYFKDGRMIEADIYVAYKKAM
jgi:hypothetical protein